MNCATERLFSGVADTSVPQKRNSEAVSVPDPSHPGRLRKDKGRLSLFKVTHGAAASSAVGLGVLCVCTDRK